MGGSRGRSYQVGHCFSLTQVHLAVQISALGIFTRHCQAASSLNQQLKHALQDVGRPMAGYLRAVFASVRVGRTEEAYQYLINDFLPIRDLSEGEAVGLGLFQLTSFLHRSKDAGCGRDGLWSAHTYQSYGSALGSSNGADGIFYSVHL